MCSFSTPFADGRTRSRVTETDALGAGKRWDTPHDYTSSHIKRRHREDLRRYHCLLPFSVPDLPFSCPRSRDLQRGSCRLDGLKPAPPYRPSRTSAEQAPNWAGASTRLLVGFHTREDDRRAPCRWRKPIMPVGRRVADRGRGPTQVGARRWPGAGPRPGLRPSEARCRPAGAALPGPAPPAHGRQGMGSGAQVKPHRQPL